VSGAVSGPTAELGDRLGRRLDGLLATADAELASAFPGNPARRQPVHTVYVPADRYDATTLRTWGAQALAALDEHAATSDALADATGVPAGLVAEVYDRIRSKLASEPVEDLRVDLEDGYGQRPDEDEDAAAVGAARVLAEAVRDGSAPPYHGIRFKSFEAPSRRRGLRTLLLFLDELLERGGLSEGLVLTLPKVTSVDQVAAMVEVCDAVEQAHGLAPGRLGFEIQVETPQSILGPDGTALVARMVHETGGRCTGLHYGTYDYSASCGIAAEYQSMEHPAADHAKAVMQVAAAGTGAFVSDGSTNVLPVGGREDVHAAWRLHQRLVRRSLERGYYQGWDLHPAQLPTRFLATYAFYREGLPGTVTRLRAYVGGSGSAFLDEPATAAAMAGFALRGIESGAVDEAEVTSAVGVDAARLAQLARRTGAR